MPGQVTRYNIYDFNKGKNSNITVSLNSVKGVSLLLGEFCFKNCIYSENLIDKKISENKLLLPKTNEYSLQKITINPKDNKCYESEGRCNLYAIVLCNRSSKDFCSFKIRLDIDDVAITMSPRKTYFLKATQTDWHRNE